MKTVNYGIYLGTMKAVIARRVGSQVEVIRNAEGFEYTPSAVWEDRQGKMVVGRLAKEWSERDPGNAFIEFKRHMGTRHEYTFARSGRKMKPEELSAEVLKSLRADVERHTGEALTAAVVTVPAAGSCDQARSSVTRLTATTVVGRRWPAFSSTMRSVPPASTWALGSAASASRASASVVGVRTGMRRSPWTRLREGVNAGV